MGIFNGFQDTYIIFWSHNCKITKENEVAALLLQEPLIVLYNKQEASHTSSGRNMLLCSGLEPFLPIVEE